MTATKTQTSLEDVICIWLDEIIPLLESLEFLTWSAEKDISIPEALRASLYFGIKDFIEANAESSLKYRTGIKFPSSVISRVHHAISHLNSRCSIETERLRSTVFLPTTIAQLAQQIPVARALEEVGRDYCFLFQSQGWAKGLDLAGIDVAEHSRTLQCNNLIARLRARVQWLRLGREDRIRLPKLIYQEREFDLSRIVFDLIANSITSVFESHALFKYLVDSVRPKLVVLGNDLSPLGRVMAACARRSEIRVVSLLSQVQDGPIDAYRGSDRFIVFGNYSKRILSSCGIDTKKINACGSPYLDSLVAKKSPAFLSGRKTVEPKAGKFVLADLSAPFAKRLQILSKEVPQHFFLFVADSRVNSALSQIQMTSSRNFRICMRSELSNAKLAECLGSASLYLTSNFKRAIEAIGLGKTVVAIDFDGIFDNREFLKSGLTHIAQDEVTLFKILTGNQNCQDTGSEISRKKIHEDYFFRPDGASSQRIVRVLIEESQK